MLVVAFDIMKKFQDFLFALLIFIGGSLTSCESCQTCRNQKKVVGSTDSGMVAGQVKSKRSDSDRYTGKYIPIDSVDSSRYTDLKAWVSDTNTSKGWKIEYYIKDDSNKYSDIYIKWSKGKLNGIFRGVKLLEYRRYFIPTYLTETESYILMTYGCATNCSGILALSKTNANEYKKYTNVVAFNQTFDRLIHITENAVENESRIYEFRAVDFQRDISKILTLPKVCTKIHKPSCIDTILFKPSSVQIKTSLRDDIDSDEYRRNTYRICF